MSLERTLVARADHRRKFFKDKKGCIYTPWTHNAELNPDDGYWMSMNQALWAGPKCLRIHIPLNETYPSCKRLFTDVLHVNDASMKDLIFEAVMFKKNDPLYYMRDIFLELEKFLEKDETYTVRLQSLVQKDCWPITDSGGLETFDELMSTDKTWFIADTMPLRMSFHGIIPLLAFSTDDISQLEHLVNYMQLGHRRLTLAAKSVPRTDGKVAHHRAYTALFQSKYEFIARSVILSAFVINYGPD